MAGRMRLRTQGWKWMVLFGLGLAILTPVGFAHPQADMGLEPHTTAQPGEPAAPPGDPSEPPPAPTSPSRRQPQRPADAAPPQNQVIYVSPRSHEQDLEARDKTVKVVYERLHRFIKLPLEQTEVVSVFDSSYFPAWSSAGPSPDESAREPLSVSLPDGCEPPYTGDFFPIQLAEAANKTAAGQRSPELGKLLKQLEQQFQCQHGGQPIPLESFRLLRALLAMWHMRRASDPSVVEELLRNTAVLGQGYDRSSGIPSMFDEGDYLENYAAQLRALTEKQVPKLVSFSFGTLPSRRLWVDGALLTQLGERSTTTSLYAGRHFLQYEDSRRRLWSQTFEVSDTGREASVLLDDPARFTVQRDEADEVLYRALHGLDEFAVPGWLKTDLETLIRERKLERLIVAAPAYDRDGLADGSLLVAMTTGKGWQSPPRVLQGPDYKPRTSFARHRQGERPQPQPYSVSLGGGSLAQRSVASLEGQWTFKRSTPLGIQAAPTLWLTPSPAGEPRLLSALWLGVSRSPSEDQVSLCGELSGGVLYSGSGLHPAARARVGVEWEANLANRRSAPAFRVEALTTIFSNFSSVFPGAPEIGVMLEARLGLRLWHMAPAR